MPLQRGAAGRVRTRWDVRTVKRRERRAPERPLRGDGKEQKNKGQIRRQTYRDETPANTQRNPTS